MEEMYGKLLTITGLLILCGGTEARGSGGVEEVVFITGARGGKVDLACYLEPRTIGDKTKLILWYVAGTRTPLFSFELGDGQSVHLTRRSATLTKTDLRISDGGLYECRVDFYRSPTSTSLYNLTILSPPDELEVDGWRSGGRIIASSITPAAHHRKGIVAGPFNEGDKLHLSCTARGGYPRPNVTWWRSDELIDGGWEVKGHSMVTNELTVPKLSRLWHGAVVACRANSNPQLREMSVRLNVKMILSPSRVVLSGPKSVIAGNPLTITCKVRGARPHVNVTWLKGNDNIPDSYEGQRDMIYNLQDLDSLAVFRVTFNVSANDDNKNISCLAFNPQLPHLTVKNATSINVLYAPIVNASLGRSLDASSLSVGDDVYLSCDVRANPPAGAVQWYKEGVLQTAGEGVVLSGSDLVMQRVTRERSGSYRCEAGNEITTTVSKPVSISLNFLPECRVAAATLYIQDEPINVTCHLEAVPAVSKVNWYWNYTNHHFSFSPVQQRLGVSGAQWSVVEIRAKSDGSDNQVHELFCYGINDIGIQDEPCRFLIEYSNSAKNSSTCQLVNVSATSFHIMCEPMGGNDSVNYRAEVFLKSGELFSSVISDRDNFWVSDLEPATTYTVRVYQTTILARPILVSTFTSSTAALYSVEEMRPKPPNSSREFPSVSDSLSLPMLLSLFTTLLLLMVSLNVYCLVKRRNWCAQHSPMSSGELTGEVEETQEDVTKTLSKDSITKNLSRQPKIKMDENFELSPNVNIHTQFNKPPLSSSKRTADSFSSFPHALDCPTHSKTPSGYHHTTTLERTEKDKDNLISDIEFLAPDNLEELSRVTDHEFDATVCSGGDIAAEDQQKLISALSLVSSAESIL